MKNTIVHISEVDITTESGMGRIEYYWQQAFERAGYKFVHIGPKQVGKLLHKSLFGFNAYRYFKKLKIKPAAFIVHEPTSGFFIKKGIPCFIESHGIERRHWQAALNGSIPLSGSQSLKTKVFYPAWRLMPCDKGLRSADKILVSNSDDKEFVKNFYNRSVEDIFIFNNGFDSNINFSQPTVNNGTFTVLFNGSWIERKGIYTLINAAAKLHDQHFNIKYLLIGTGSSEEIVLNNWPDNLKNSVTVVPFFKKNEEQIFLQSASVFVLPSYFEGQPLSLIQAMANGKCCITTNCCGQKDLITNCEDGYLFEVGDEEALAKLIKQCYLNPGIINKTGAAAYKKIQDRSWAQVADEVAGYMLSNLNKST